MEFSSSLPLDLLALADPATRGAPPPLAFRPGDASGGGAALPFELCLELLEPVVSSGEPLPLPGNPLPVALDEDTAPELDAAETLALALPGFMPAPIVAVAPPAGSADAAAADAAALSLVPSAALPTQAQPASTAAEPTVAAGVPQNFTVAPSAVAGAPPSSAPEAPGPTPSTAAADADANAWLATLADTGSDTPAATAPAATQPAALRSAVDSGATATTARPLAADADYAAEAAVVAPRSEPSPVPRRSDEPSRGTPRISWREALTANAVQPSQSTPLATADTPDAALPTAAPAASPFVAALRGDIAAASGTSSAPVAEAGAAPGGHAALHAATAQHSSATAQTTAAATPDRAPVDTTTPRWQEAFASRVQWLADQNIGEAHIRLNPPELGAVDVKISLVEDRTFVQLTTHTTAARDELAQSLPRLRELFAASGLDLGGASVATGRDGQARNDGAPADQPYASRQGFASGSDEATAATAPSRRSAAGASRIDLFA
jgi:flagellar hook-length control protein FliK